MKTVLILIFVLTGNLLPAQTRLLVAVQQYRDSVVVFDVEKGMKTGQAKIGFKSHEIAYDPVSKKCFISDFGLEDYDLKIGRTGNSITVFDPETAKVTGELYTSADTAVHNGPHGVKVRPGNYRELFVNTEIGGDTMIVYDLNKLAEEKRFGLPSGTHNFTFSSTGDRLWLMSGQNGVYEINAKDGSVLQHAALSSPVRGLLAAKNWLIASCKNEIFLLSKTDLSVIRHFDNLQLKSGLILYSNITDDQKYILAPAPFDNVVLVIDAVSGKVLHRLHTGETPINVQVNGNHAYVSHARDAYIGTIDLKDFTTSSVLKAYGTNGLIIIDKP
ncbi:MAG TPA: hypothetical protein VHA56_13185 [Mucilaginibacter sp.]|nr:hypothetical protein [Mucilaginibacter sp.]